MKRSGSHVGTTFISPPAVKQPLREDIRIAAVRNDAVNETH
jgi:hypothetical protein